jgi:DNA-binding GntR family transcriptional regulator
MNIGEIRKANARTPVQRPPATSSGVGKASRVADAIVSTIESGVLREGDRLPSEEELAARHGVSVGTIQKVLGRLSNDGLIRREHGRGTFVSGRHVAPADVRYLRFMDEQGGELTSYVHAHGARTLKRKGRWSDFLGGESFVRVDRAINVAGRIDLYSEFWMREDDFRQMGVEGEELERNLRELIVQRLALPTLRVDQWIHCAALPEAAERALGLDAGQPGFIMELRGYTLRDRPLYFQSVYSGPFSDRLVVVR